MPLGGPVRGGDQAFRFDGVAEAGESAAFQLGDELVPVARAEALPVGGRGADVGVGAGGEDVVQMPSFGGQGRIVGGGPGDQQGRVAHQLSGAGEFVEGALPGMTEGEGVVGQFRPGAVGSGMDDHRRRGVAQPQRAARGPAEQPVDDGQVGGEDHGVTGQFCSGGQCDGGDPAA